MDAFSRLKTIFEQCLGERQTLVAHEKDSQFRARSRQKPHHEVNRHARAY